MTTVVIDTQILLWAIRGDRRLPEAIRLAMGSDQYRWVLHQVSLWEIQIKYDLGKLPLPQAPRKFLPAAIAALDLAQAPVSNEAIFMVGQLPKIHRDPFDRLLIAEAIVQGWCVATADATFEHYPVRLFT